MLCLEVSSTLFFIIIISTSCIRHLPCWFVVFFSLYRGNFFLLLYIILPLVTTVPHKLFRCLWDFIQFVLIIWTYMYPQLHLGETLAVVVVDCFSLNFNCEQRSAASRASLNCRNRTELQFSTSVLSWLKFNLSSSCPATTVPVELCLLSDSPPFISVQSLTPQTSHSHLPQIPFHIIIPSPPRMSSPPYSHRVPSQCHFWASITSVSYTHLDVYKRQV